MLFLSHGKILLEGDPKTLPREHGKETLEELFITVARELAGAEPTPDRQFGRSGAIFLRQFYLLRGSPARIVPLFAWVAIDIVPVGLHHALSELSQRVPASTSCRRCWAPCCCGISSSA